jgi:hypothetical protein
MRLSLDVRRDRLTQSSSGSFSGAASKCGVSLECDRHRDRVGVGAGRRSSRRRRNNAIDVDRLSRTIAGAEIAVTGCRTAAGGRSGGPGKDVCGVNV